MSISTELTRMAQNAASVAAAKAAIASAITSKGGTVGASDGLLDFPDAIVAIPGGGDDPDTLTIKGATGVKVNADYPVKHVVVDFGELDASKVYGLSVDNSSGSSVKSIVFRASGSSPINAGTIDSGYYRYGNNSLSVVEYIEFDNVALKSIYQGFQSVYGGGVSSLKSIIGLDMRYANTGNYTYGEAFRNLTKLENVTLIPNTFGKNTIGASGNTLSLRDCSLLTDESLISIANGLCADHVSTVQLHATPGARLSTIMGTVSQETDDTGTYSFFTASENGDTSLEDFITVTKGWTIA